MNNISRESSVSMILFSVSPTGKSNWITGELYSSIAAKTWNMPSHIPSDSTHDTLRTCHPTIRLNRPKLTNFVVHTAHHKGKWKKKQRIWLSVCHFWINNWHTTYSIGSSLGASAMFSPKRRKLPLGTPLRGAAPITSTLPSSLLGMEDVWGLRLLGT